MSALTGRRDGDGAAVLLDLDGTLVDSRAGIVAGMNATLQAHGLAPRLPAELEARIGPPVHDTFAWLFDLPHGDPQLEGLVDGYRERYADLMLARTPLYAGILEALAELQRAGYVMAIATSKARHLAQALAEGLGLTPFMAAVLGPVPPARDDKARTIAHALAALGHPSRAVMVGDRLHDVEGAGAHGLPAIGVLWGIGDREELQRAGAAALCEQPRELPAVVEELLRPGR
ncbi:MAG: family hydrolase [Solirubrobacterales bacterium]|jgi:phosphoglycolate phosphatase|nr:family hydrolase [Solirubrobacterales bacterium]